jgi:hypothetical protein
VSDVDLPEDFSELFDLELPLLVEDDELTLTAVLIVFGE